MNKIQVNNVNNKVKIEFWLNKDVKDKLKKFSKARGYSVTELLKRFVDDFVKLQESKEI